MAVNDCEGFLEGRRVNRLKGECCKNLLSYTGLYIFICIIGSNVVSIVLRMTLDQVSDMFFVLAN